MGSAGRPQYAPLRVGHGDSGALVPSGAHSRAQACNRPVHRSHFALKLCLRLCSSSLAPDTLQKALVPLLEAGWHHPIAFAWSPPRCLPRLPCMRAHTQCPRLLLTCAKWTTTTFSQDECYTCLGTCFDQANRTPTPFAFAE